MNYTLPLAVYLLAVIPRGLLVILTRHIDPGWSPHWNLATGLIRYGTFGYHGERVTNIEPGYPFFIAVSRLMSGENLPGVLLIQAAVGSLGAVFLYYLALEIFLQRKTALYASILYAFYPYLIGQSISIIEVTVFTTLLISSALFYVRAQKQDTSGWIAGALCGISFGLTILVRSMVLPAFTLAILWFLPQRRIKAFAMSALLLTAVSGPWFFRSHAIDGSWIPPRGGWNLLQGNCIYSDKIIPRYNPDLLDGYVGRLLEKERPDLVEVERETDAVESEKLFKMKAFEFMIQNPWRTIKLKIKNIFYLFYPRIVPFHSMDENTRIEFFGDEQFAVRNSPSRGLWRELSYSLTYTPIFLIAFGGAFYRRKKFKEDIFFYLIGLNFIAVYALCWPATRLRVPMDFIFMLYAAYTLSLWNKKNCPTA